MGTRKPKYIQQLTRYIPRFYYIVFNYYQQERFYRKIQIETSHLPSSAGSREGGCINRVIGFSLYRYGR